jgi:(p)ppGpp synthase/HD superfamily hydrolase
MSKRAFRERFAVAAAFAADAHKGQLRKGTAIPYITHPLAVAENLARFYPDATDLIVAGVLHDVVEDTDISIEEIEARFGAGVARLVAGATKVNGDSWRQTRQMQIDKLREAELDMVRLKAADAQHNAESMRRDLVAHGPALWKRFRGDADDIRWYYQSMLEIIAHRLPGEPLVDELSRSVAGLA